MKVDAEFRDVLKVKFLGLYAVGLNLKAFQTSGRPQ